MKLKNIKIMLHVLDLPLNGKQLEKSKSSNDLTHFQRALTVLIIVVLLLVSVILILVLGGDPPPNQHHVIRLNNSRNRMSDNNTSY